MILSLDISLQTGWAFGTEGNITFGTRSFQAHSHDNAVLGRRFNNWLCDLISEDLRPKVLIIEKPLFYPGARSGATSILHGLAWEAHRVAEAHDIPRFEYTPIQIKKFITGNGRAKKPDMIHAMITRGYKLSDDHQADAGAMLLLHDSIMKSKEAK